jgi:glycosyltransferase involved in cell wall biosynthesis
VGVPQRDFLLVQSSTELGGAERVLLNLLAASEELRRRSLTAVMRFGAGNLAARLREVGAEVVELPRARVRQPLRMLQTALTLRALVRARGIRVVVGNGAHPQILAGWVARLSRAKSAFVVHMIHRLPLGANERLDVLAIKGPCDLMLANSQASLTPLRQLRPGVDKQLLHLGTPTITVRPEAVQAARAELGAASDEVVIGVFGRLQRWKAQDVFLAAAALVGAARPKTRFVIVGGAMFGLEPEYFVALRAAAAATGFADRIVFTDYRQDVAPYMAACDIICHTSRVPEPFGMVVIEAMSLGKPVIATQGGGPSEIIAEPDQGILVPPDDPAALAAALISLIDDPERRARLGARGRERVISDFGVDTMARNFVAALERLAQR